MFYVSAHAQQTTQHRSVGQFSVVELEQKLAEANNEILQLRTSLDQSRSQIHTLKSVTLPIGAGGEPYNPNSPNSPDSPSNPSCVFV